MALVVPPAIASSNARFDAVVAPRDRHDVPAGPRHASLGEAFAAAPARAVRPFRIWIATGEWREQLDLDRPHVHLVGEDRARTRICFTAASGQIAPDGRHYGTYRTAVLKVGAPGFAARNLTIANDFDGIAEMRKTGPRLLSDDPNGSQAVALYLATGSDQCRLDDVDIDSHQDTLFVDAGTAVFTGCRVLGSYDFIFGAGTALFDRCTIHSRLRPDPAQATGYIAAPSTLAVHIAGLVFDRCRLTRDASVPDGSVFLGRPWRPSKRFADGQYGNPDAIGMASYIRCWMDGHINSAGWTEMWYTNRAGNSRTMLQPEDARFSQYENFGPGAALFSRGSTLTTEDVKKILRATHRRSMKT